MFFWVMTVKQDQYKTADTQESPFSIQTDLADDNLNITISGRLDTITSPELLSIFQKTYKKGRISTVTINLQSMTYISSAGLRVFLIIRKTLERHDQFHITNMNETVKEIMSATGFLDLFSCEF